MKLPADTPRILLVDDSAAVRRGLAKLLRPLGAETLLHGFMDGHDEDVVARVSAGVNPASGERIPLFVSAEHFHLFDPSSGARL